MISHLYYRHNNIQYVGNYKVSIVTSLILIKDFVINLCIMQRCDLETQTLFVKDLSSKNKSNRDCCENVDKRPYVMSAFDNIIKSPNDPKNYRYKKHDF